MDDVYRYIDENRARFIAELESFLRIPSVATDAKAVEACSSKLKSALETVGFTARLMKSSGNPMVYGELAGNGCPDALRAAGDDRDSSGKSHVPNCRLCDR